MTGLLERLRAKGWRLTAQRRAVAGALDGDNVHLTADEVLERARELLPGISRATVYNTLGELVEAGELAEVVPDGRAKRYDPNAGRRHHHLVCSACGSLQDIDVEGVDQVRVADEQQSGFRITGVDMFFRGLCPDCVA